MSDQMSARRRTLLLFFLFVMFGALGIGYLFTFHLDTIRRVVQQEMLDAFGKNLQVSDIQVSVFPSPALTLTNLQILESEQGDPVFQAARIRVDLGVLSILQDDFVPKGLIIEDPQIYLHRNEDGQWNVETVLQNHTASSTGVGSFLVDYSLTLENGFIQIVDAFENPNPVTIELHAVEANISNLSAKKPIEVFFSANLNEDPVSQLSFEGTLSDVEGFFTTAESGNESFGPNVNLRTRIELKETDLLHLVKLFHISDFPQLHTGQIQVQSDIQYFPGTHGQNLVLSDLILLSHEIDLHGEVTVSGLLQASPPNFSAAWSSTPIRMKDLIKKIPEQLIPDRLRNAMADQSLAGTIEVVSAVVSKTSLDSDNINFTGEFKLSEGFLDLGKKWGVAEHVQGTVVVQPDGVQLRDIQGIYDSIPVSSGTGNIEFQDAGPWFSTELQGTVPSKKLLEILRTVFGWTNPDHSMSRLVGERGAGKINIRFAGPLDSPERIVFESAQYDAKQVTLHMPGIEGPLTNVTGTVTFSQTHVSFEPLKGLLGTSPIGLQGTIKFQDSEVFDTLQLTGRVSDKDLASHFRTLAPSIQSIMSGTADVVATISGPIETPRIQTRWNIEGLELNLGDFLNKKKDTPGMLDVDLAIQAGQRFKIHQLTLALPALSLSGQGSFGESLNVPFKASFSASPFDLSTLPSGVVLFGDALKKGTLEFLLTVNGKGDDWRLWNKSGWVKLGKAALSVEGLNSPLSEVALHIKFERHMAKVERLQFHMQESQAQITGSIKNWDSSPKVKFEMLAPQFDIDLLIPKGERSPVREALESIAATQTVGGNIHFRRAWYKDLKFQDLHGRLQIKNGIVGVDKISGQTESGNIQGRLLIHLPVEQPATVKTWMNMENVSLPSLQTTFLSTEILSERLVTGTLSVLGQVEGHGKDPRGIFPTLNGNIEVLIKDGRIRRGTIIPKLLAVMNLPSILQGKVDLNKDGYPFDKQSATITINNGIMTSTDIIMDGPILKLTGAGSYNLVDDRLDLAIAASPFGPYFDLLRKVSIFRLLLEGDQKSIGMAIFDVKGSLQNPTITSLPLESFKTGLTGFAKLSFNVLKNTLTLPKTILFPEDTPDVTSIPNEQAEPEQEF